MTKKYDWMKRVDHLDYRQMEKICKKLRQINADEIERYKTPLVYVDMHEEGIFRHKCGTTACHAGWMALALDLCYPEGEVGQDLEWFLTKRDDGAMRWWDAADEFANKILKWGYSRFDLEEWASIHPGLWGNRYGSEMFTEERAFISPGEDKRDITLMDIIVWWENVCQRGRAFKRAIRISKKEAEAIYLQFEQSVLTEEVESCEE